MYQSIEDKEFQKLVKRAQDYSIYDEVEKNTVDKNVVKKLSILYEVFQHINKVSNVSTEDFVYTSDIKDCLRRDSFVKIRFHIIPLKKKAINSLDEKNYNFIDNINNVASNMYLPTNYDRLMGDKYCEDKEKLNIMLKRINEIECAYIYKYRSDSKIKLTFDIFCHNLYIFLSYDYKKHLSLHQFKNKYNQLKEDNQFKLKTSQNMLQLNSIGLVLKTHDSSFEEETLEILNPFIYESETMIKELHAKKNLRRKNIELENDFFLKNSNYEENMRQLIHFEKIKDEYKRLKKGLKKIQKPEVGSINNYL